MAWRRGRASLGSARISAKRLRSQAALVMGRSIEIEIRAAAGVDGGVARHAELHVDALEERFAEFEDAGA